MATARFTSAEEEAEWQFANAPGEEETEDSQEWPEYEETGASKSTGKTGDQPQQVEGGPEVPPKENPPPVDPTPGTSKDSTDAPPAISTKDPMQDPPRTPPRTPLKPKPRKQK